MKYVFEHERIYHCENCPFGKYEDIEYEMQNGDIATVKEYICTKMNKIGGLPCEAHLSRPEWCPLEEVPEVNTELISHIVPDYKRGIRRGLESYEAIEEEANKNFNKILKFFDE